MGTISTCTKTPPGYTQQATVAEEHSKLLEGLVRIPVFSFRPLYSVSHFWECCYLVCAACIGRDWAPRRARVYDNRSCRNPFLDFLSCLIRALMLSRVVVQAHTADRYVVDFDRV